MDNCKICSGSFADSPDKLVLCEHKTGLVHLGCCTNKCSQDHKPCIHCKAIYGKEVKEVNKPEAHHSAEVVKVEEHHNKEVGKVEEHH
jgi:hypothetical protein